MRSSTIVYSADERLFFAQGYKYWTVDEWSKMLFGDEKHFYGQGRDSAVARRFVVPRARHSDMSQTRGWALPRI